MSSFEYSEDDCSNIKNVHCDSYSPLVGGNDTKRFIESYYYNNKDDDNNNKYILVEYKDLSPNYCYIFNSDKDQTKCIPTSGLKECQLKKCNELDIYDYSIYGEYDRQICSKNKNNNGCTLYSCSDIIPKECNYF